MIFMSKLFIYNNNYYYNGIKSKICTLIGTIGGCISQRSR